MDIDCTDPVKSTRATDDDDNGFFGGSQLKLDLVDDIDPDASESLILFEATSTLAGFPPGGAQFDANVDADFSLICLFEFI